MNSIFEKIISRPPKCLSKFLVVDYKNISPNDLVNSSDSQAKQIACQCGEEKLFLMYTPGIITRGIIKRRKVEIPLAPVSLNCSSCKNTELLFNPTLHGWDAECGYSASTLGDGNLKLFSKNEGEIIVVYTYQNIENYEDLIEDEIENIEDFFDTFSIYFLEKNKELTEVVSYECA